MKYTSTPSMHSQRGRFLLVSPPSDPRTAYAQTVLNDDIVWHSVMAIVAMAFAVAFVLIAAALAYLFELSEHYGKVIGVVTLVLGIAIGAALTREIDKRRSSRIFSEQEARTVREHLEWSSSARSVLMHASPLMQKHLVEAAHVHRYPSAPQEMRGS